MTSRCLLLFLLTTGPAAAAPIAGFAQTNLVSNVPGLAANTDASLQNPWGMAFSATSPLWVSDNDVNLSTLYNGAGTKQGLIVSVPGSPTGVVFNATAGFNADAFIFATQDGNIEGWRGALGTNAETLFTNANSNYTGLATGVIGTASYLYAANFEQARVDVFGSTGAPALAGNFTDPNLPAGYAPFGIETIGSEVFVAYAKVNPVTHDEDAGPGNGFVSVFNLNGTFVRRAASQGALNAPWGLAVAPAGFGSLSGDLLVGNFGDGTINAFDGVGNLIGTLATLQGTPLVNDGLWAIKFGNNNATVRPGSLYITAGLNDEADGLLARIDSVPEPGTVLLLAFSLGALIGRRAWKAS